MQFKTILILGFAGLCGLVAMMGVQQVLSNNQGEAPAEGVKVLVATTEILPGQPLDEKNVTFKDWPRESVPEGAVTKPEQMQDRSLRARVFAGDMITETKLNKKGVHNASSDVPSGMQVASIPIDPTMAGAGLIRPGDRVDVLVTYGSGRGRDGGIGKEIKTVLESIEVFAIDGQRDSSTNSPANSGNQIKNVSLLVTSKEAKLMKLADDVGDLHLTLRANGDDQRVADDELFNPKQAEVLVKKDERDLEPVNTNEPLVSEPVAEAPPPVKKWKIAIYKGSELQEVEVDLPEEKTEAGESAKVDQPASKTSSNALMGTVLKLFGG